MTEDSSPTTDQSGDRTLNHASAGTSPDAVRQDGDYRDGLRSRRWNAAPLENPEVQKTDPRIAVLAIAILSAITLVVLMLGYLGGVWTLGPPPAALRAVAALELLA